MGRLPGARSQLIVSLIWTSLALGFLLACDLLLFRGALLEGKVYYRSDTVTYYFPVADRLVDALREGQLLLWTQHIFGGFPLFADGEAGMLYPPNLIAYLLLPEPDAFIWSRVARYFMAAVFTFAYLHTLRLNRFAATVGALSFAFGGFLVTQMHHTNVANTAIWLPLTLAMVELAVRHVGRARWLYATGAGTSVGIQALALHVQPLLMSGFFLAIYLPFRVLLCPIARPVRKGREGDCQPLQGDADSHGAGDKPRRGAGGRRSLRGWVAGRLRPARDLLLGANILGIAEPAPTSSRSRGCPNPDGPSGIDRDPEREPERPSALGTTLAPGQADGPAGPPACTPGAGAAGPGGGETRDASERSVAPAPHLMAGAVELVPTLARVGRWAGHFLVKGFHRTVLACLLLAFVPAIAFGIAAAQVLPLVELGFYSFRGPGVTYQFATSYSMPVQNLVNLLFPYFYRYTNFFYWSLWSEWETTIYTGIGPLVLAAVALIFVRSRMVLFFAVATAASVLLAFGSYSPYPLYEQLWHLPGFSSLRVPGRFGMLITFSVAVLAAYGVDWLCRTLRPMSGEPEPRDRRRRFSRAVSVNGFAIFLVGLLTATAAVFWWLVSFRIWIEREPWAVKRMVEESYLSLRNDRPWLTSDMVLSFLNYSLDPTNPKTATSLALMLGVFLLLFCWFAFRRLWRGWATLLVALVAADMLLFAQDFHPTVHVNQLSSPESATRWLMAQNGDGMTRVYTPRDIRKTEPNKLLPFQVSEIAGYSSLETVRHQQYMGKLNEFDRTLLDLYNVRFVVLPKRPPALPSYESTSYHPNRPLADGPRGNRGSHVTFYVDPPVKADEVAFVSNLRSADGIPQNADVADIVVVDDKGERVTLKVKAGRDTAEWAWDRPDVTPHVAHQKPRVVDKVWASDAEGRRYQANLYYGRLPLGKTRTVSRVEFHYTNPKGAVRLYGMMLWEKPSTAHQLLSSNRYIPRYEDDEVQILENPSRLPRAFLVPTARIVKRWEILDLMAHGDFDPTKTVLLETEDRMEPRALPIPDPGVPDPKVVEAWLQGNPDGTPGTAEIVRHRSTEVQIRTNSSRNAVLFLSDSYYPGWKALVDGRPSQVYRANYLFRAVLVPEGEHEVQFRFEPDSFALGTDISLFTLWGLLILWFGLVAWSPMVRLARRQVKLWRARAS